VCGRTFGRGSSGVAVRAWSDGVTGRKPEAGIGTEPVTALDCFAPCLCIGTAWTDGVPPLVWLPMACAVLTSLPSVLCRVVSVRGSGGMRVLSPDDSELG